MAWKRSWLRSIPLWQACCDSRDSGGFHLRLPCPIFHRARTLRGGESTGVRRGVGALAKAVPVDVPGAEHQAGESEEEQQRAQ